MDRLLTGLQSGGADYRKLLRRSARSSIIRTSTRTFLCSGHARHHRYLRILEALHRNIINAIAMYIACGVNPDLPEYSISIYSRRISIRQSGHGFSECFTPHGDLHQNAPSLKQNQHFTRTFTRKVLVTYPDLMAADILLYDPKYVPTGGRRKEGWKDVCRCQDRDLPVTKTRW